MKRRIAAFLLACTVAILFAGCGAAGQLDTAETEPVTGVVIFTDEDTETAETESLTEAGSETESETKPETEPETDAPTTILTEPETSIPDTVPTDEPLPASVEKDGSYTTPEDVAEYIHTFGALPGNFITKNEAKKLGWDSSAGNLWDVAPGKSIGGDHFGNREGLLPDGDYKECDVNYDGGYRGAERLIFGTDGSIYYTNDHYKSFTQLY